MKCVKVIFRPNGQSYIYSIPPYINEDEIKKYVIVEDAFYDKRNCVSPYKVVEVVGFCEYNGSGVRPTKCIVDTIDGYNYVQERQRMKRHEAYKQQILDELGAVADKCDAEQLEYVYQNLRVMKEILETV